MAFYGGPVARAERKKGGRGARGSASCGGENGEERGGPGRGRGQLGRPATALDRRTGEGGGARVTRRERLTGGTGDSGARWPAAVCERE
jgi:hypothetical protein